MDTAHRPIAADPAKDDVLIIVDGLDRQVGTATKLQAHEDGLLHRALSVVLYRNGTDGVEALLARRASCKYHSAGLWANSCCSHPRDGEATFDAAIRRIQEELGCTAVALDEIGAFAYRAPFENGLVEYEYDHVFVGECDSTPSPDPNEVSEVRWAGLDSLAEELAGHPERFAAWAPMVLTMAMEHLQRASLVR
ncbi:MAG: isopentenyl-diphosphate Delta-isomerase [Eggerthellaceae bacterium]|nr:isopentenyl-diphosphate Delta-isomerase [Eggerthellaceae bacterium]